MEPIAPVNATAATYALPVGEGGLTAGAIVRARVARVDGDTALLRWGEQTVSVASRVPLSVGQQVNLLVEEAASGTVLLRMVDDTSGKGRPARADAPNSGRGTTTPTVVTGPRGMPVSADLPGRASRDPGSLLDGRGFADPPPEWGLPAGSRPSAVVGSRERNGRPARSYQRVRPSGPGFFR